MKEVIIPKVIKIGCHTFKSIFFKGLIDGGTFGRTLHVQGEIMLNPSNSYSQNVVSWWHEVLHAIGAIYCSDKLEESVVDSIAEGLGQVFEEIGVKFDFSKLETASYANDCSRDKED